MTAEAKRTPTNDSPDSSFNQLRELIFGQLVSQALQAVVRLGVAEQLKSGPRTAQQLATAVRARADILARVLRSLAAYGVFVERSDGRFELSPAGEMLCRGPRTLHSFLQMFSSPWNQGPFSKLDGLLTGGDPAFEASMGTPFFEYLRQHPEAGDLFNEVMTDFLGRVHKAAADAYDFSGAKTIVDVGGGHGSLMVEVLKRNPKASGIIFDLPDLRKGVEETIERFGLTNRCRFIGGNFFESVPKGGDVYLLSRVLHDWDDQHAQRILSHCREAVADGRLLLVEQIMLPDNQRSFTKLTDLWMMIMFNEGRERTESEYHFLLNSAGFRLNRIVPTAVTDCVIEALPAWGTVAHSG